MQTNQEPKAGWRKLGAVCASILFEWIPGSKPAVDFMNSESQGLKRGWVLFTFLAGLVLLGGYWIGQGLGRKADVPGFPEDSNRKFMISHLKSLNPRFANYKVADLNDLNKAVISDLIVFVSDIPRGPNVQGAITGKRFVNCALLGPQIVALGDDSEIENCTFGVALNSVDTILFDSRSVVMNGVVGFKATVFKECVFRGVGFAGIPEQIDRIKLSLPGK